MFGNDRELPYHLSRPLQVCIRASARRVWFGPTCPSSIEHMLLHLPMSPDCEVCQLAKISVTPARRTEGSDRATEFDIRFYLDLIGPVMPDLRGNIHLLVGRDEGSGWAVVAPMLNKAGPTITKTFKSVTSGTKLQKVRPDWGKEFQGPFEAHCERLGIEIERGLPCRSTTFARAERWHRTLEEGVRSSLLKAGLGVKWWSLCAVMWTEHWNRLSRDNRPSPFVRRYHRESGLELKPFGP